MNWIVKKSSDSLLQLQDWMMMIWYHCNCNESSQLQYMHWFYHVGAQTMTMNYDAVLGAAGSRDQGLF